MELKVGKGIGAAKARDGRVLLWVGDKIWHISFKEAKRLKICLFGVLLGWDWNERTKEWHRLLSIPIESESCGAKTVEKRNTRSKRSMKRRPGNGQIARRKR